MPPEAQKAASQEAQDNAAPFPLVVKANARNFWQQFDDVWPRWRPEDIVFCILCVSLDSAPNPA